MGGRLYQFDYKMPYWICRLFFVSYKAKIYSIAIPVSFLNAVETKRINLYATFCGQFGITMAGTKNIRKVGKRLAKQQKKIGFTEGAILDVGCGFASVAIAR